MAYFTEQVIADAYYLSNIISREFEEPTGNQIAEGLDRLNDVIEDTVIDNNLIPYADRYNFTLTQGVGEYFIPDLIFIETYTFFIGSIRYAATRQQLRQFFGSFRALNIESLPLAFNATKQFGGVLLSFYFLPQSDYPVEIWGQFRLSQVALNQDLSLTIERFYINYLKYALAVRLCEDFGFTVPPHVQSRRDKYVSLIASKSNTVDLTQNISSPFARGAAIDYAFLNLSQGWVPTSGGPF